MLIIESAHIFMFHIPIFFFCSYIQIRDHSNVPTITSSFEVISYHIKLCQILSDITLVFEFSSWIKKSFLHGIFFTLAEMNHCYSVLSRL